VDIALISLDQLWEDKSANLDRCAHAVARASDLGADLVIFPEMTLTGFSLNVATTAEEADDSSSLTAFARLAARHAVRIIAGVVLRRNGRVQNTAVAFAADGSIEANYAKMHPFTFAGEDRHFSPGDRLVTVPMPGFSLGLSICYDLRFPELFCSLANSCEVLVTIANWPQRRVGHWRTLLQARAIENRVLMIGVNRTGIDGNGLAYERSSLVFDANGTALEPIRSEGEIDLHRIDLEALRRFRAGFPTRPDRRPDLFRHLL